MISFLNRKNYGPIGIDLGSRSVKLIQLNGDRTKIIDAARWDLPFDAGLATTPEHWVTALKQAREGRKFRGNEAVVCLGTRELFVQNIRINKPAHGEIAPLVYQEAEPRLPFPAGETELRFVEAADVRQGDALRREVIVMACHRPVLEQLLQAVEAAGLRPAAVELEAAALMRCYEQQFRRDEDRNQRMMLVHVGNSRLAVLITQGVETLFFKYIELGGKHLDDAVARHLNMSLADAWALRRHNGDRRADQQDPEVARSVAESIRPLIDRLMNEVSMCVRYHNVTFRGQPLQRLVLAGGEATPALVEKLTTATSIRCELGDPLRAHEPIALPGRKTQWDIALGLALRPTQP